MPDRTEGWTLGSVESVPDPEKGLPPWDRTNPAYGVGAGKDEKAPHPVSMRLTTKEHRDLQRIVQHRKYPLIETTTDALRVGLVMLRYWYAHRHGDEEMQQSLDVEMWENERMARTRFRQRVLNILEAMAVEMAEAERLGYTNRLSEMRAELAKYKAGLVDEELLGKANRLFVQYTGPKKTSEERA